MLVHTKVPKLIKLFCLRIAPKGPSVETLEFTASEIAEGTFGRSDQRGISLKGMEVEFQVIQRDIQNGQVSIVFKIVNGQDLCKTKVGRISANEVIKG